MLKLENSQYPNFIFQFNYMRYGKSVMIQNWLDIKIHKFKSLHFSVRCIIFFSDWKNTIENRKFKFLTTISEIRKRS